MPAKKGRPTEQNIMNRAVPLAWPRATRPFPTAFPATRAAPSHNRVQLTVTVIVKRAAPHARTSNTLKRKSAACRPTIMYVHV